MELLWGVVAFLAVVACHATLLRLPVRGDSVTKFALAGGLVGLVLGMLVLAQSPTLVGLAGLVLYAFACEVYTFLFTLVGSSVSVQILLTLRGGPASATQIDAAYATAGMVEGRIAKLQAIGLLDPATGKATERGRLVVRVFLALRRFFRHSGERGRWANVSAKRR
jgi:hypothetical protein